VLYLSHADVLRCGLAADEITHAVEEAFRGKALGRAVSSRRLNLAAGTASFTAKAGVLLDQEFAAVKWYGYVAGNARRGLPDFSPLIVLNAIGTGLPLAVLDGRWITAVRTAAITTAAAGVLAKPDSRTVGFVACGAQAQANLAALQARFGLERVVAYSRRRDTAERFAAKARERGLVAGVADDPKQVLKEADIVVTSVPPYSEPTRFLDASDVREGAFVSMVDLGFAWNADRLDPFEVIVTDDLEAGVRTSGERLNYRGEFAADLGELLAEPRRWSGRGARRSALIFAGSGLADTAAAVAVYRRAVADGIGHKLPFQDVP
jgi:ornithine cyclodeaminase/alanine dehydrogenase-like protein (mu-crystallin family)